MEILRETRSVCPICLKPVPAKKVLRGRGVYLEKECPEHGAFSTVVWRNREDLNSWIGDIPPLAEGENLNCPNACGLCAEHRREYLLCTSGDHRPLQPELPLLLRG